ncbi:hypothetical protein ACQXR1_13460 [Bacillus sp. ATD]|uniref:hypothetical protein n=1 Tax=Bacillus sp. ATD TaxID=3422305 RepID=UPI003D3420C3
MKDIMTFLLSGGITTGIAIFLIKTYVNNLFNKNIESYKVELTKSLKDVEFDYQRKFEDFSLYTQKRHQVYAELYRIIQQALRELKDAMNILEETALPDSMSKETLYKVLVKEKFDEEEIDEILAGWNFDPFKTIDTARIIIDEKRIKKANNATQQAWRFFMENELYISDEIADLTQEILRAINDMYATEYVSLKYTDGEEAKWNKHIENDRFIKGKLKEVKEQMKEELSIGYYKPTL